MLVTGVAPSGVEMPELEDGLEVPLHAKMRMHATALAVAPDESFCRVMIDFSPCRDIVIVCTIAPPAHFQDHTKVNVTPAVAV